MSADGMSIYDRIERTDRIEEKEGPKPRSAMSMEDTKSMVVEPRKRAEPPVLKSDRKPKQREAVQVPVQVNLQKPKQDDQPTDPVPRKAATVMDEEETPIA